MRRESTLVTGQRLDRLIAKMASHSPEFLQAVRGKKFRNPDTGNEVLFVSLPPAEQAKIYEAWGDDQERDESGKRRRHSPIHEPEGPKRVHDMSKAKAKDAFVGDDTFETGSFVRHPDSGTFYEVQRSKADKVYAREVDEHGRPISRSETIFRETDPIQKVESKPLDGGGGKKAKAAKSVR